MLKFSEDQKTPWFSMMSAKPVRGGEYEVRCEIAFSMPQRMEFRMGAFRTPGRNTQLWGSCSECQWRGLRQEYRE